MKDFWAEELQNQRKGRVLKVDSTSEPGIYNYSSLCTGSISDCAIQTHNGELKIRYLENKIMCANS